MTRPNYSTKPFVYNPVPKVLSKTGRRLLGNRLEGYVLRDENGRVKPIVFRTKKAAKEAMWAGDTVYALWTLLKP